MVSDYACHFIVQQCFFTNQPKIVEAKTKNILEDGHISVWGSLWCRIDLSLRLAMIKLLQIKTHLRILSNFLESFHNIRSQKERFIQPADWTYFRFDFLNHVHSAWVFENGRIGKCLILLKDRKGSSNQEGFVLQKQWKQSLCGCFDNFMICLATLFCAECVYFAIGLYSKNMKLWIASAVLFILSGVLYFIGYYFTIEYLKRYSTHATSLCNHRNSQNSSWLPIIST